MNKTFFALILCICLLFFSLSSVAENQGEILQTDIFSYVLLKDNTVHLISVSGWDIETIILTELDGHKISSLGKGCFKYCPNLEKITLPDSISTIEGNPFSDSQKLSRILISPDHPYLATIDGVLFSKKEKKLICVPQALELTEYNIPQGIVSIGEYAFSSNSSIRSVTIPSSLQEIEDYAFSNCVSLEQINIPETIFHIGKGAFSYCSSLKKISIPKCIEELAADIFLGCISLADVTIPENIKTIDEGAFACCNSLTSVFLPNSITTIKGNPFWGCSNLTAINSASSCFSIINGVLYNKIEKTLVCYPYAFTNSAYNIPDGTVTIGSKAFYQCNALFEVSMPNTVTKIEDDSFSGCISLTEIILSTNLQQIGEKAFYECSSLTYVSIPNSVKSIEKGAFWACSALTGMIIPEGISVLSDCLFDSCTSLIWVEIPSTVTSVGYKTFFNCKSLQKIVLPEGVTFIGERAFEYCSSLKEVCIPASVIIVEHEAFIKCSLLTLNVERGSYAETYAIQNDIPYIYPSTNDWLTEDTSTTSGSWLDGVFGN